MSIADCLTSQGSHLQPLAIPLLLPLAVPLLLPPSSPSSLAFPWTLSLEIILALSLTLSLALAGRTVIQEALTFEDKDEVEVEVAGDEHLGEPRKKVSGGLKMGWKEGG